MSAQLAFWLAWAQHILGAPPQISGFDDLSWVLNSLFIISFLIGIGLFLLVVVLRMMGIDILGVLKTRFEG